MSLFTAVHMLFSKAEKGKHTKIYCIYFITVPVYCSLFDCCYIHSPVAIVISCIFQTIVQGCLCDRV